MLLSPSAGCPVGLKMCAAMLIAESASSRRLALRHNPVLVLLEAGVARMAFKV